MTDSFWRRTSGTHMDLRRTNDLKTTKCERGFRENVQNERSEERKCHEVLNGAQ